MALTPEEKHLEAERGEKLWREFNRGESTRRLLSSALAGILIAGIIFVVIFEYKVSALRF